MKTRLSLALPLRLAAAALALASFGRPAQAQIVHQFVALHEQCPPSVWFQALTNGQPAAAGHAGMLALGMQPYASAGFPPALWGGWFRWTQQGAFLSYASGTLGTTEIHDPAGAPILDVRGACALASSLDVMVDVMTGDIFAVTLYSGLYFWTPGHVYLLLVGGPPTVYEIVDPAGAAIPGVRGIACLAAEVDDLNPLPTVTDAVLFSGAAIFNDAHLYVARTFGSLAIDEVTSGGSPIPLVRGVMPMGGHADTLALAAGSYFWTPGHAYQMVNGVGGITLTELLSPAGAALSGVWGITRQTPEWTGAGSFGGAATLFTAGAQFFTNTFGPIPVQEVPKPGGGSLTSDVHIAGNHSMLRQGGGLMEVFALFTPAGGGSKRGTVIGLGQ
jgi:hypothetical protein